MTKTKSTKRALLMSALALLMCVSMLIGTTFAWFTDNVTSTNNIIKAGNLDVELEYYDGDSWEKVKADTNVFEANTLWEPGHTEVVYLKVSNLGSLALKYQLGINVASEIESISVETNKAFKLSDFIKFSVVGNVNGETAPFADRDTAVAEAKNVADGNKKLSEGYSDAGFMLSGDEIYMAMVVYMPEEVGNAANHKTGEPTPKINLGLNLMATQKDFEEDTYGNDYDVDASVVIDDINLLATKTTEMGDFVAGLEAGATVFIKSGNYELTKGQIIIDKPLNIVGLGTVNILNKQSGHMFLIRNYGANTVDDMTVNISNLNLDGNYAERRAGKAGFLVRNDVNLNLTDVTVRNTGWANIQFDNAYDNEGYGTDAIIRGTHINVEGVTMNATDTKRSFFYYDVATSKIGSIEKQSFNPIFNASNMYINGDNTASGGTIFFASNDAELAAAIASASTTGETMIVLGNGTFTEDITLDARYMEQKGDIVFKADEGATPVIAGTVTLGYYENRVGAKEWDAKVTFEGITFDHKEAQKHSLSVQSLNSVTLRNCTIYGDGEYGIGSQSGNNTGASLIEKCTFINAGMQIYGNFGTDLVIDKCTFEESQVNVGGGNGVTVQNCTFNKTMTDVNNGDSFYVIRSPKSGTPVTVKNCEINVDSTVNGLAVPGNTKALAILHNRHATKAWTITDVAITMTDAALAQPELKVIETAGGAMNATNLTVNGGAVPTPLTKVSDGLYKDADAENYYVYNAAALISLGGVGPTHYQNKTYTIMNDIDFDGAELKPIGSTYGGTLTINGNGKTLSNLKLVENDFWNSLYSAGLFFASTDSKITVNDLKIDGVTVATGDCDTAVLVGYADGNSEVILNNVDVANATVTSESNAAIYVGYTAGKSVTMTDRDITGTCSVTGEAGRNKTGAYAGTVNTTGLTVTITNCTNNGITPVIGRNYSHQATVKIDGIDVSDTFANS